MSKFLILFIFLSLSVTTFAREVDFAWEPFPDASDYEIQISPNRRFDKLAFEKKMKEAQVKAELEIGQYYYRVRAYDENKRAGKWSNAVLVSVKPYAPDLVSPEDNKEINYFENKVDIQFEWKDAVAAPEYEIYVYLENGKKIFEKKSDSLKINTDKIGKGSYLWKVRSIHKKKNLYSEYSKPRKIIITQTPFEEPKLIDPIQKKMVPAYRDQSLSWKSDKNAKYNDITIEDIKTKKVVFKKENIEEDVAELPHLLPGEYRWRVNSKEGKKTTGVISNWENFTTSTSVISKHSHVFRSTIGYSNFNYLYNSDRTGSDVETEDSSNVFQYQLYCRLQLSQGYGLSYEGYRSNIELNGVEHPINKVSISNEFRFGENGFQQSFYIGYRQMDVYEIQSSTYNRITTTGWLWATNMEGYLNEKLKLGLQLLYYKPEDFHQGNAEFTGDQYEARFRVGWNLLERLWIHWEMAYDKGVYKYQADNAVSDQNTRWVVENYMPVNIALSYEY